MTASAAVSAAREPSPAREPFFDNAKFLLIFLVVWGHALGPLLRASESGRAIYVWMHFFHMPAFVFIAGYFSSAVFSAQTLKKNMQRLLLPYAIFQILFSLLDGLLNNHAWNWADFLSRPYFHLWFLLTLFYWRAGLFLILKIKHPFIWACALSLAVEFFPLGRELSLARTFTFLPLFVLGYQAKGWDRARLRTPAYRLAAGIILLAALGAVFAASGFNYQWLFGCYPYAHFKISLLWAPFYRAAVLVAGLLMGAAFLSYIPERSLFFTVWGARSLYVYIFHLPLFKILKCYGFFEIIPASGAVIISFLLAAAVSAFFSCGLFQRLARPLVEPGR